MMSFGSISADHNLVVDGTASIFGSSTLDQDVIIGGGYNGRDDSDRAGVTITKTGAIHMNENLLVGGLTTLIGNLNAQSGIDIGTGYGGLPNQTGSTLTATGEISMESNLIIGGGYGKTGTTLTSFG